VNCFELFASAFSLLIQISRFLLGRFGPYPFGSYRSPYGVWRTGGTIPGVLLPLDSSSLSSLLPSPHPFSRAPVPRGPPVAGAIGTRRIFPILGYIRPPRSGPRSAGPARRGCCRLPPCFTTIKTYLLILSLLYTVQYSTLLAYNGFAYRVC
jgi:hypothetical protein